MVAISIGNKLVRIFTVLFLGLLIVPATHFAESHSGVSLAGSGTATIDGIMGQGEWDNAGYLNFPVNVGGGETTPGTFFVMNDAINLYLALLVQKPSFDVYFSSFSIEFNNEHNGEVSEGDDGITLNPPGEFGDVYRTLLPPCPPGGIWCGLSDVYNGGSNDGGGWVEASESIIVYEMYHPLDSLDDAHDFSLAAGDIVGWFLGMTVFIDSEIAYTYFPFGYGDIIITPAADLAVSQDDLIDPVVLGGNLVYEITVTNNGPSTASEVQLIDYVPPGMTVISATPSQGSCSGSSTITCDIGNLDNTISQTVTLVLSPASTGTFTNTIHVTSSVPDQDTTNNMVSEETTIINLVETIVIYLPLLVR
jgi:uncharacterized repeat protein (TIGR01451 family)